MKILVFEQRYTRQDEAGIARFNLLSRYWDRAGHKVTIISGMVNYVSGEKPAKYRGKLFVKENESENVTVVRAFDSAFGYRTFLGRLMSYFTFMCSAFWAGIFVGKPDVIIASSPPIFVGPAAYAVSFFRRVPFVFEVRDLWPDVAVKLGFLKSKLLIRLSYALERFLYARTRFIVVNSPGLKEFLIKEKKMSGQKIGVVPNPIDFDLTNTSQNPSVREEMGWNDRFVVIYSGALSAVYDFDTLFEAAKKLSKKPTFLFALVGDGRQRSFLEKRIRSENISNISLLPPVSKSRVANLISAADVCIAPLKDMRLLRYVYATKLFDYMAAKKPIVLAMEGTSADLVCKEARCGICISPGDRDGLEKAILELFNSPSRRQALGKNGYYFAQENFSASILASRYLDLLKPIIIPD